jgi:hypothetical protein
VEFHTLASRLLQIPFMWQKGRKESSAYEERFTFIKGWLLHFLCFMLEDCSSFETRRLETSVRLRLKRVLLDEKYWTLIIDNNGCCLMHA